MTYRMVVTAGAAIALTMGTQLGAQTCLGRASFASGPMRAGASYGYRGNTDVLGGEFAYGTAQSGFAAAELGVSRTRSAPSGFSSSSTRIGGTFGTQVTVSNAARVQFCPTLGVGLGFSSSESPTRLTDSRTPNVDLGFSLGMATGDPDKPHFIPSVGFKYGIERTSGTLTNNGFAPVDFHSVAAGTGYAVLALGIARGALTITPVALLPIADKRKTDQWGVGLTYNFGRRP